MLLLYVVLSIVIPAIMIFAGVKIRSKFEDYLSEGLAYRTKSAKQTPEAWHYANRVFGTMLAAIGANMAVISVVIVIAAVCAAGANGFLLVMLLACIEIVCVVIPVYVTEKLHGKLFDADGVPLLSGFDAEPEEVEIAETDTVRLESAEEVAAEIVESMVDEESDGSADA